MAEHTTIVSMTYQILGESPEYSFSFPVTANTNTTMRELLGQVQQASESPELLQVFAQLGTGLISHMAKNTKDSE